MKRFLTLAAMAALSLGAAACGGDDDDDPAGPGDGGGSSLSTSEVADAFDALSAIGLFSFGAQPLDLPAGLALQSESFDETESCPNGGTVRIQGSVNYNQTGSGTVDIRQTYNNCQSESSSGRVWTFNGDPNLRIQMTSTVNQTTGAYSITGSMTGGFRYSSGGKSGSCSANINISANANGGSVTGTMCGQSINESFDGD